MSIKVCVVVLTDARVATGAVLSTLPRSQAPKGGDAVISIISTGLYVIFPGHAQVSVADRLNTSAHRLECVNACGNRICCNSEHRRLQMYTKSFVETACSVILQS